MHAPRFGTARNFRRARTIFLLWRNLKPWSIFQEAHQVHLARGGGPSQCTCPPNRRDKARRLALKASAHCGRLSRNVFIESCVPIISYVSDLLTIYFAYLRRLPGSRTGPQRSETQSYWNGCLSFTKVKKIFMIERLFELHQGEKSSQRYSRRARQYQRVYAKGHHKIMHVTLTQDRPV